MLIIYHTYTKNGIQRRDTNVEICKWIVTSQDGKNGFKKAEIHEIRKKFKKAQAMKRKFIK